MVRLLSLLKTGRLTYPTRRVLALDAGSRSLRILVAESEFGRVRILKQHLIDLHQEGLVSTEETQTHLSQEIADWGNPPIALILPQHLAISQTIDVPAEPESDVEKLIKEESVKLGGVSDSQIVYDFVQTGEAAHNRHQFWVTLAREADIRENIVKLGIENEDLCHLTTTSNALLTASRLLRPDASRAVLVHAGAETTILAVIVGGRPAFASSYQMGGDFFSRSLARIRNITPENADTLRRETDLFKGPGADPKFIAVVDGWAEELKRQLDESTLFHADSRLHSGALEFMASGRLFDQPGLLDYLRSQKGLNLQPWPTTQDPDNGIPGRGFEAAYGAARQALEPGEQSVSLLPEDLRQRWRQRLGREKIELASLALLVICALLLIAGTLRQFSLLSRKQALLSKVRTAQTTADENETLSAAMINDYETLRPLFARQQNTFDVLKTLALLEQSRSNRSCWYVLIGDQQSYFTAPISPGATNRTSRTNLLTTMADRSWPLLPGVPRPMGNSANVPAAKPGMIAELCISEDPEAGRVTLSQIVKDLKQQPIFSKVDLLSDDQKRNVADPKVVLPDKDFVLALDFAATDFLQPATAKRPPAPRAIQKRSNRQSSGNEQETASQATP